MPSVPFRSDDGLIRVPVQVWGVGLAPSPLSFVIDTGTPRTLIDVEAARRLGFLPERAIRPSRVVTAVGVEGGYVVVTPRIRALGWDRDEFEIACHLLGATARVDGLLGGDFFDGLRLVIDYGTGVIELMESARAGRPD
ncbi:MAG: aspartyl protease family protein [Deltaproteobacteria bacterium]|nr:aspartyl protease family protein [Deltaproteobacteria bacterium]